MGAAFSTPRMSRQAEDNNFMYLRLVGPSDPFLNLGVTPLCPGFLESPFLPFHVLPFISIQLELGWEGSLTLQNFSGKDSRA